MTQTATLTDVWVKNLKNGDEVAAMNIYNMYSKAMYNTLVRITGNSVEAQDLLQEAFVKAFKKIDTFREEATFGAWLKRIVVNTGLEFLRKKKVNFDALEDHSLEDMEEEAAEEPMVDPELIHECIKQLPSGSRTVLTLYLLEDYSHKEIAEKLDITVSTSKTQYMRGKKLLKELIKNKIS